MLHEGLWGGVPITILDPVFLALITRNFGVSVRTSRCLGKVAFSLGLPYVTVLYIKTPGEVIE